MPQFEEDIYWFYITMEQGRFLILLIGNTWIYMTSGWFEHSSLGFIIEPYPVPD